MLNKEILKACKENNLKTNVFKIYSKYAFKVFELIHLKGDIFFEGKEKINNL